MGRLPSGSGLAAVLGASFVTFATPARAQADWSLAQPPAAPSHRDAVRLAWDPVRRSVLLFGGNGHVGLAHR